MAEPVGSDGELDRHERPAVLVRGPVVAQVDHRRLAGDLLVDRARRSDQVVADDAGQEVVRHGPLVVPARQSTGGLEHPLAADALRPRKVDEPVVEPGQCLVQLDDDEVLVVARLRDDGSSCAVARHVQDAVDVRRDQELVRVRGVVELGLLHRPAPVDRVEVVARCPEVDARVRVHLLQRQRGVVEGDVVVDELADEREPGEEPRAGVQVVVVRDRLVLDHGRRQALTTGRRGGAKAGSFLNIEPNRPSASRSLLVRYMPRSGTPCSPVPRRRRQPRRTKRRCRPTIAPADTPCHARRGTRDAEGRLAPALPAGCPELLVVSIHGSPSPGPFVESVDGEVAALQQAAPGVERLSSGIELGADARSRSRAGWRSSRPSTGLGSGRCRVTITSKRHNGCAGLAWRGTTREPCRSRCGRPVGAQEDQLVRGVGGRWVLTDADHGLQHRVDGVHRPVDGEAGTQRIRRRGRCRTAGSAADPQAGSGWCCWTNARS